MSPVDRQSGEARSGKHPESVRTGEGETFGERAERLGGEARNHEAVEAILNRIIEAASRAGADGVLSAETVRVECLRATYALDAVRRSPKDMTERELEDAAQWHGDVRSPQGEDHEAGIEAAAQALCAWPSVKVDDREHNTATHMATDAVAAYLSRCPSPERDTEKLQRAIDVAFGAMNSSAYVGGPTEREAWQTALAALGEVVTQHKGQGDGLAGESSTTEE